MINDSDIYVCLRRHLCPGLQCHTARHRTRAPVEASAVASASPHTSTYAFVFIVYLSVAASTTSHWSTTYCYMASELVNKLPRSFNNIMSIRCLHRELLLYMTRAHDCYTSKNQNRNKWRNEDKVEVEVEWRSKEMSLFIEIVVVLGNWYREHNRSRTHCARSLVPLHFLFKLNLVSNQVDLSGRTLRFN